MYKRCQNYIKQAAKLILYRKSVYNISHLPKSIGECLNAMPSLPEINVFSLIIIDLNKKYTIFYLDLTP